MYVFYMFRTRGFLFRKTVVHAGTLWYVVHAKITIKGFYKVPKYEIFELYKYIEINIKHSS